MLDYVKEERMKYADDVIDLYFSVKIFTVTQVCKYKRIVMIIIDPNITFNLLYLLLTPFPV